MASPTNAPQPETLTAAVLLAATGGLLDAVVYLLHGHVFANAMTGNVILLGISALSHDGHQALRHLTPILAFLCGVAASRLLRLLPYRRAGLTVLVLEGLTLGIAGLLPLSFPQMLFTAMVAFVSAFQVSTFRRVGRFSYNSTFVTGNLRELSEGFISHIVESDVNQQRREFAKARKLSLICAAFLGGAMLGAWDVPHFGDHTLWFSLPLLIVVGISLLRTIPPDPS